MDVEISAGTAFAFGEITLLAGGTARVEAGGDGDDPRRRPDHVLAGTSAVLLQSRSWIASDPSVDADSAKLPTDHN